MCVHTENGAIVPGDDEPVSIVRHVAHPQHLTVPIHASIIIFKGEACHSASISCCHQPAPQQGHATQLILRSLRSIRGPRANLKESEGAHMSGRLPARPSPNEELGVSRETRIDHRRCEESIYQVKDLNVTPFFAQVTKLSRPRRVQDLTHPVPESDLRSYERSPWSLHVYLHIQGRAV